MKQQRKKEVKVLSISLFVFLTSVSCIKKRPDKFRDNSGLAKGTVVKKSVFLNQKHTVRTLKKNGEKNFDFALTLEGQAEHDFKNYDPVEFSTDSPYLPKGLRFRGEEGRVYSLEYDLVGAKLHVYKVIENTKTSFFEKFSKLNIQKGEFYKVLLSTCPVSYFNEVQERDRDGRATNESFEDIVSVPSEFKKATHISVNEAKCEGYDYDTRFLKFLPKSFFTEKSWQMSVFKVDSSDYIPGGNSFILIKSPAMKNSTVLRRVKFIPQNKNTLAAVSNAIPGHLKNNNLNQLNFADFPTEWMSYKIEEQSDGSQLEKQNAKIPFEERDLIKIDFLKGFDQTAKNLMLAGSPLKGIKAQSIEEVIIADDLFSIIFNVKEGENQGNTKYRMNFMKDVASGYQPVSGVLKDMKRFGNFLIEVPVFDTSNEVKSIKDEQKVLRKIRFNPENKKIVYHLTTDSPKSDLVLKVAQKSIERINNSFKKVVFADAPKDAIQVVLSKKRVRRGDPRYNIIDFNSENNFKTTLGLGMPHYDEVTGEVLSAISYTYYGAYNRIVKNELYEYLKQKANLKEQARFNLDKNVYGVLASQEGSYLSFVDQAPFYMSENNFDAMEFFASDFLKNKVFSYGQKKNNFFCFGEKCSSSISREDHNHDELLKTKLESMIVNKSVGVEHSSCNQGYGSYTRFKFTDIESKCEKSIPHLLKLFVDKSGSADVLDSKMALSCVESVLENRLIATTVHEILHNFGLAHNFTASADETNYLTPELIKKVYSDEVSEIDSLHNTSSIMDYSDSLGYPSLYDWAALKYTYRNMISTEVFDGQNLSVLDEIKKDSYGYKVQKIKPIALVENETGLKPRPYDYCSDFEANYRFDPLCARWDRGRNPEETVKSYISEFFYYRRNFSEKGLSSRPVNWLEQVQNQTFGKLNEFYSKWRVHLYSLLGEDKKYLEGFTSSKDFYESFKTELLAKSEENQRSIMEYFAVRNVIYSFYRDIIFRAPKACVFIYNKNAVDIDYNVVYNKAASSAVLADKEVLVSGCETPIMQDTAKNILAKRLSKRIGVEVQPSDLVYYGENGSFFNSYSYDLSENSKVRGTDVVGMEHAKYIAMLALAARNRARVFNKSEYFLPNFLDEPEFRENFQILFQNRIANGYWVDFKTGQSDILSGLNFNAEMYHEIMQNPSNNNFIDLVQYDALVAGLSHGDEKALAFRVLNTAYLQNEMNNYVIQKTGDVNQLMPSLYKKQIRPRYLTESGFLNDAFGLFRMGLEVPGNINETKRRIKPYEINVQRSYPGAKQQMEQASEHVAEISTPGYLGDMLVAPKTAEASFAVDIIKSMKELSVLNEHSLEPLDSEFVKVYQKKLFGTITDYFQQPYTGVGKAYGSGFYQALLNHVIESMNADENLEKGFLAVNQKTQSFIISHMDFGGWVQELINEKTRSADFEFEFEGQTINTKGIEALSLKKQALGREGFARYAQDLQRALDESDLQLFKEDGVTPIITDKDMILKIQEIVALNDSELLKNDKKLKAYNFYKPDMTEKRLVLDKILKILAWF